MLTRRIRWFALSGLVAVGAIAVGMLPGLRLVQELGYWVILVMMPASLLCMTALALTLSSLRGPVRGQPGVVRMGQAFAGVTLLGVGVSMAVLWSAGVTGPVPWLWGLGSSITLLATLIIGRTVGDV